MFGRRGIEIKTPEQIALMREAGLVVGRTLELLREAVRPGVTTGELDALAEEHIRDSGATPSFKGYADPPFPATICASVNDEVVHGIPGERVLRDGDAISIDCGAIVDGWHGDAATTVAVGEVSEQVRALMTATEESLWRGIAAARLGGRLSDIGHAIELHVSAAGPFEIVEGYTGHGIGSAMHQPPAVENYGRPGRGPRLVQGMALAVEPMVVAGRQDNEVAADRWTVRTLDGSPAAHYEHTFTLLPEGAWVLTALDGGKAWLDHVGAPCAAG